MVRLPNACCLPRCFLAIAVFVASQYAPLLGQSSPTTKNPSLDVLSAEYLPETDTIQFRLVNHSNKAATAYYVAFGLMNDAQQVNWGPGFGEDLLNVVLNSQCRNARQNLPADNSLEGAIKPGDTYIRSVPANLDRNQLNSSAPAVHAEVAGIIWSDGSVEERKMFPAATASMNGSRDHRRKDAGDTAKVVAILNAHPDDPDVQHRIGEAIKSLQALLADDPRVEPASERAPGQKQFVRISPVVGSVLANLKLFASSPDPKEAFEAYSALLECQNEHRSALLQPTAPAEPGQ
jgi:hypothetical protein